jgi:hypothetical protein
VPPRVRRAPAGVAPPPPPVPDGHARGRPSVGKGGSLLLKLSTRLLACVLHPLEPLLCRGKGGGLVSQAGPQQLGLLSLLLGLALPGPRPLEGGAVLLELGSGESQLKASRPLIRVLVINDKHYGLKFLFEL